MTTIVVFPVRNATRPVAHTLWALFFHYLAKRGIRVKRAYAAVYSDGFKVSVDVPCDKRALRGCAKRALDRTEKIFANNAKYIFLNEIRGPIEPGFPQGKITGLRFEPRGELSEFHALFQRAALHPESINTKQLSDAFHWFMNFSGRGYVEEVQLLAREVYSAVVSFSPDAMKAFEAPRHYTPPKP